MLSTLQATSDSAISAKALASAFHLDDRISIGLALGHTISISLLSLLVTELAHALSGLDIRLVCRVNNEIAERLRTGKMEVALAGVLKGYRDRLDSWPLFTETYVTMVPTEHHLGSSVSL